MADKMMRVAGRGPDGKAKAIKTDLEGNLGVQSLDAIRVADGDLLEANSILVTEPVSIKGIFTLSLKLHSVATFKVSIEYLNADGNSSFETDLIGEIPAGFPASEATFDITPKYPYFRFLVESTYTSDRFVWMTLMKHSEEPLFKWLNVEENSITNILNNVNVNANGSVSTELINTAGYHLNIAFHWESGTNMRVRINAEYYNSFGTKIDEDENIFYSDHTSGNIRRLIPFIPRYNLVKFVIFNDSNTDREIKSLSISRVKQSEIRRLTQVVSESELIKDNKIVNIPVPEYAYGASLYLIVKDYTSNKNAHISMRIRNGIEQVSGYTDGIYTLEGWNTELVYLDGKSKPSVKIAHVSPEAMYLQSYPPDESAMASSVIGLKLCPTRLSHTLNVNIMVGGEDFAEGEGVEVELICDWHV